MMHKGPPIVPVEVASTEPAFPPPPPMAGTSVTNLQRLELKPTDTILFEMPDPRTSHYQVAEMKERLKHWFPDNEVIVTVGGRLRVLDRQQSKPPADTSWLRSAE